jgi:hypothetical protein
MTLPTRALGRSGGAGILQTDSVSRDQRFIEVQRDQSRLRCLKRVGLET